jgi:hypothetical protein
MSRRRVNPVNLFEPLAAKVHTVKPHDMTPAVSLCEPCVPFLEMVMMVVNRGGTHGSGLTLPSGSNKVHKVHSSRLNRRLLAVLFVYLVSIWYTRVQRVHPAGDSE